MTSSADVIILSSSPSTSPSVPTRLSSNTVRVSRTLPEATTTPSTPSPSELFLPPSRSRFFDVPARKDDAPKKQRPTTTKTGPSEPKKKVAASKPRQKANKVTNEPTHDVIEDLEPESLDSRKNVAKKTAVSQKGRSKTKAHKETGNLKIAGKVTKASKSSDAQTKPAKKAGQKAATVRSTPVDSTETSEPKALSNYVGKDEALHLDEAMTRRRDWTPPRETFPQPVDEFDDGFILNENREFSVKGGFGILADYNYSASSSDAREINANEGGPTKRRRIELVDPQCQPLRSLSSREDTIDKGDTSSSSGRQPKRKPKTKKRFTTLTARITAQYTSNNVEEDLSAEDITQYTTKSKPRGSKNETAGKAPELIVLSPEAAFKALDQQDVVFGTCSQLERDDSPETLREMQRAIRASETLAFGEGVLGSSPALGQTSRSQSASGSISRFTGARNLWSVAGRDTGGSSVRAENVDNIDLTEASSVGKKKDNTSQRTSKLDVSDDEWLELDNEKAGTSRGKRLSSTNPLEPPAEPNPPSAVLLAPAVQDAQPTATESQQTTVASQQVSMPQYSGFTDAELSRQVAAYGFKSVKGRKKMIDLLQKCWESKHGKASQPDDVSSEPQSVLQAAVPTVAPSQTTSSPKSKSKGKTKAKKTASTSTSTLTEAATRAETVVVTSPKRNQQPSKVGRPPPSSYIDIEEIQDSDDEVFLSPSQVQKRYTEIFSNATTSGQVRPLEILTKDRPQIPTKPKVSASKISSIQQPSSSAAVAKTDKLPSTERASLLDISFQITKAVRVQPQLLTSGSRNRPTWHEKILMYDPIVLEDFTSWLNVEGLGLVGEDREVGTAAVRDWCEGKGICCCWKKNASW